ncbi:MAG: hypothetical protein ACLGIB_08835 [Actinomycetota bacterium]
MQAEHRRPLRAAYLVLCGVALAGALVGMPRSEAATSDRIVYQRLGDIFTMAPDGSDKVQLTAGAPFDSDPVWSPDRSRISFVRCCSIRRPGHTALIVMNADGTDRRELTSNLRGSVFEAEWSPDGTSLVYADVIPEGDRYRAALRVVTADGTSTTSLTGYRYLNVGATWSPDGRLAFMSDRDGDIEIWLMSLDGSKPIRLTNDPATDFFPQWSPDGSKILWIRQSEEYGWSQHLYVMNADGTDSVRLTTGNQLDEMPRWSPDGTRIAFIRYLFEPEFDLGLWLMDADGSNATRLVDASGSPAWSSDGASIAYEKAGEHLSGRPCRSDSDATHDTTSVRG